MPKNSLPLCALPPLDKKELIYQTLNFLKMDKGFTKQKVFEIIRPAESGNRMTRADTQRVGGRQRGSRHAGGSPFLLMCVVSIWSRF